MPITYILVGLQQASESEQSRFDERMQAAGLRKTTRSDLGVEYRLPDSIYASVADRPNHETMHLVGQAIAALRLVGWTMVLDVSRVIWDGLERSPIERRRRERLEGALPRQARG